MTERDRLFFEHGFFAGYMAGRDACETESYDEIMAIARAFMASRADELTDLADETCGPP